MSGFTPGPWVVERADDAYCIANVGNLVIMPCAGKVKHDNAEADARLISAAPDLLEALELLNQSAPAASCEMFHHEKQDRHTFLEECPPADPIRTSLPESPRRPRQGPRHPMLTGPEVLILCAILAALYMWDWWRRNWKGD